MNTLVRTALLSIVIYSCEAFTPVYSPSIITSSTTPSTTSRLYGINEWRDDALQSKYTLDSYKEADIVNPSSSVVTGTVPILPFPFSDLLLQGQRTQLNLYEQRFHELFQDAIDNHCGMVGMGLLAGNGMITTLPLCEIESFTRLGYEENWINKNDGMGNGSIFVTIRAVGRCKIISEDGLLQEEPYMKATVMELVDEDITESGVREKKSSGSTVSGESSPIEIATLVASNIENEMVSLANMEHRLKELEDSVKKKKEEEEDEEKKTATTMDKSSSEEDGDEVMNRRLIEAQLESLFMQDSSEGVDIENTSTDDHDDEEEDDEDESTEGSTDYDEKMDRVAQFQKAFDNAVETDTFGYKTIKLQSEQAAIRTPKDITAISWAAFCTGDKSNMQREVMKIQALDMTNVLQRLHLAAAMLMEEKKKLRAKMALAGIKDSDSLQSDE